MIEQFGGTLEIIEKVQQWYSTQCDGAWEHQYGVSINTVDNPGWIVSIDLTGTELHNANMGRYQHDRSDNDWIFCEIRDQKFVGSGDPFKLVAILEMFLNLLP